MVKRSLRLIWLHDGGQWGMRKMLVGASLLGLLFGGIGVSYALNSRPIPYDLHCASAGSGPVQYRILVIGESWASKGRLLPDLPDAVAKRSGAAVRACQLGWSGATTAKLITGVRESRGQSEAEGRLGGEPTNVIILNSINDQVANVSPDRYAAQTEELAGGFPRSITQIVSPPIVNQRPPSAHILQAGKRWISHLFGTTPRDEYERALFAAMKPDQVIPYREFSAGWKVEPKRYTADGIHLIDPAFQQYGAFLGLKMTLTP